VRPLPDPVRHQTIGPDRDRPTDESLTQLRIVTAVGHVMGSRVKTGSSAIALVFAGVSLATAMAGCASYSADTNATRATPLRDARLLVSVRNQTGAAYLVRGDGSRREIRGDVGSVRRSPNGRWITHLEPTGRRVRGYPVLRLVSSRPDGREVAVLRVPRGTGAPYSVAAYDWSPDSCRLALALSDFGGKSFAGNPVPGILAIARRDGSAMRRLASCESGNGPEWSPTGLPRPLVLLPRSDSTDEACADQAATCRVQAVSAMPRATTYDIAASNTARP
jgi:hypothetical protein